MPYVLIQSPCGGTFDQIIPTDKVTQEELDWHTRFSAIIVPHWTPSEELDGHHKYSDVMRSRYPQPPVKRPLHGLEVQNLPHPPVKGTFFH
jgi:hypothetical protein